MDYGEKNILVLGAGSSGIGAAWVLAQLHANVVLNDYKPVEFESSTRKKLDDAGVTIITGRQDNSLLNGVDRIVISPGIALSIPIVQEAFNRHIEVVSEVELAYDVCKSPILGVTGTNGKTTTTTLLTQVMESTGLPIKVGGNIGDSLSEAAFNMPEGGYLIAELSSYQLETIKSFCPLGAIVLNVTPDHLARHKTMENYAAAKARIFMNQNAENFVVLNDDDPIVAAMKKDVHSKILSISQHHKVECGAYFEGNTCYAVLNGNVISVIDTEQIHIKGAHNIENILSVIALTYALGVDVERIKRTIENFHGVEHRLERVTTIHDVTFYNDSKATNTDSVVKALDAFDKPVILLAGGHDKMTPLEDFMNVVKKNTKEVIFMGEAAERFESVATKVGVTNIHRAQSMKEAVELGYKLAEPSDIVLLSPACSSFDWYSCFEERGDDFKKCVKELEERG
ncbi:MULTISPECIES: UDP-N-acetylmuramoyl-L-alanine--D-glutamate ligase [Veillonella]|jgi:UDP-N-acetylmuramoyl-L-alanine--D-glutamate ligase|uniref:UDP-N-acetylmuramoylalanine--D-glutamate ligase n=1 Tax=Veillonella tobetsuensis TaxID=1110546 RepID=A0A480B392_9FIRM|nr:MULTISPECIES: UDP-N-acetylmuramoyl-L-alanine--D-glutamate ligase [Veillonella]MDU5084468.1 UDP-N-acetylmuramoyl-L-alanine--D-glutamate ligase [Veillonella sp.]GCL67716.1 UDP-N-acetylmuramoylalanine--D-glutamate ligase [Veillonella tobetsuensis]GCL69108.1 UDP-N-acetylmuramoylalanine--D-glutamate ligase [Veillonella tobetsuensis]